MVTRREGTLQAAGAVAGGAGNRSGAAAMGLASILRQHWAGVDPGEGGEVQGEGVARGVNRTGVDGEAGKGGGGEGERGVGGGALAHTPKCRPM
jgi:hypothetical protein